jgi:hypothetical protein
MMEEKIKELEKWVKENYNRHTMNWTAERSMGNYDDCFDDGADSATSWAAYEVGHILGMELEEPDKQDEE